MKRRELAALALVVVSSCLPRITRRTEAGVDPGETSVQDVANSEVASDVVVDVVATESAVDVFDAEFDVASDVVQDVGADSDARDVVSEDVAVVPDVVMDVLPDVVSDVVSDGGSGAGQLDRTFGTSISRPGVVPLTGTGMAWSLAINGTGAIFAAGARYTARDWWGNDPPDTIVWKLLPNGTLDRSFGTAGVFVHDFGSASYRGDRAWDVVLLGERTLVTFHREVSSDFASAGVARLTAEGTLDTSFAITSPVQGALFFPAVRATASRALETPNGSVRVSSTGDWWFALKSDYGPSRLNAGYLLSATANGEQRLPPIAVSAGTALTDLVLEGDRVVAVGYVGNRDVEDMFVARFTLDGVLDSTFGRAGIVTGDIAAELGFSGTDEFRSLVVTPDGHYVALGFVGPRSTTRPVLYRMNRDGSPAPWPGTMSAGRVLPCGVGEFGYLLRGAVDARGNIYVTGACYRANTHEFPGDTVVFALRSDGQPITNFGNGMEPGRFRINLGTYATSPDDVGCDIAIDQENRVVVAGMYRFADAAWQPYVLRLNAVP